MVALEGWDGEWSLCGVSSEQEGSPMCGSETNKKLWQWEPNLIAVQVTEITLINNVWQESGERLCGGWHLHVLEL